MAGLYPLSFCLYDGSRQSKAQHRKGLRACYHVYHVLYEPCQFFHFTIACEPPLLGNIGRRLADASSIHKANSMSAGEALLLAGLCNDMHVQCKFESLTELKMRLSCQAASIGSAADGGLVRYIGRLKRPKGALCHDFALTTERIAVRSLILCLVKRCQSVEPLCRRACWKMLACLEKLTDCRAFNLACLEFTLDTFEF